MFLVVPFSGASTSAGPLRFIKLNDIAPQHYVWLSQGHRIEDILSHRREPYRNLAELLAVFGGRHR